MTLPGWPAGLGESHLSGEALFHTLREPWWFIPFDLLRVKPLLDGFPVFGLTSAGSRPGGRPSFLLRQERRQRRRPGFTGHSLGRMTPLRCSQRAAGAELALRAQTAAPDFPARCCSAVQTGFQRSTEPLRKPIWRLTVDHLHFRSPLTCRLEVMTGGKRASHV